MDDLLIEMTEEWESETGLDFYKQTESRQQELIAQFTDNYVSCMEYAADLYQDR